jgi:hypothetical protein
VSGTLRFLERESADTAIGPVVVILEAIDPANAASRPTQLFHLTSSAAHFDPGFSAVRDGDYIVFVNEGPLSHRFFSAGLGPDVQIPVRPAGSSEPQRLDHTGERSAREPESVRRPASLPQLPRSRAAGGARRPLRQRPGRSRRQASRSP